MPYRVGIDIGGTFTDLVFLDESGNVISVKVPSTPADYAKGIESGLGALQREGRISGDAISEIIHGTTVATNTILEHKGARTGLLTTEGFRDVLEIRRLRMPVLYDLRWRKPEPLVPRARRLEVVERVDHRGEIDTPLDLDQARESIRALLAADVSAIAICLLNAYANGVHERRLRELVREESSDVSVCLSSEVLPEIREYERTSTTVVNAYIAPMVERYIRSLEAVLARLNIAAPFLVMQSNGGAMGARLAADKPIHIIESGPAAGVVGGAELAKRLELDSVLTFDMGGTTAKASMVEKGQYDRVGELDVGAGINAARLLTGGGYIVRVPAIDIAEVGAGGGSLVGIDPGGALTVGPESAGAEPGPVCYGRGNETPTVTDANLALGYLNPAYLVGGALALDRDRALVAIEEKLARPLGLSVEETAYGVHTVANAAMSRALRSVSSERGRDPRDFALVAFGGNGGVHAASLAELMGMTEIVIPPVAGVYSALGLLFPETQHHYVRTFKQALDATDRAHLESGFAGLEAEGRAALAEEGYADRTRLERLVDMRYAGENSELTVPAPTGIDSPGLAEAFHRAHDRTYGYRSEEETVELINVRVIATGLSESNRVPDELRSAVTADVVRELEPREVYFGSEHDWLKTPVVERDGLDRDPRAGPLIVEDYAATTVVPPCATIRRGDWDVLRIDLAP